MERTLQVIDYAVLIISGTDGVQGHTETVWKLLQKYRIPPIPSTLPPMVTAASTQMPGSPMDAPTTRG